MSTRSGTKEPPEGSIAAALKSVLGGDQAGLGRRVARELIAQNSHFRSAKENVEREISEGGRIHRGSFRL